MMDLTGRTVRFHLSAEGRKALRGLVPVQGSFQAFVLTTGELGPLVYRSAGRRKKGVEQEVPAMLIRWDYIATMTFDFELENAPARAPIGFRAK